MTIQTVISHASVNHAVVTELTEALMQVSLPPSTRKLIAKLNEEADEMLASIKLVGRQVGAGNFPNTFVKDGVYMIVHDEEERAAAVANGAAIATFPETMVKQGFPDRVVNDSLEKDLAIDAGYTLPGLGPQDEG